MSADRSMLLGMAFMMIFVIFIISLLMGFDHFSTKYNQPNIVHEPRCDMQYNLYYFLWQGTPVATMNYTQKKTWCLPTPTWTYTYRTPTPTYCYSYYGTGDC